MKILSFLPWVIFPSSSSWLFPHAPSTLSSWGLFRSPSDIARLPQPSFDAEIFMKPGFNAYVAPSDYELSFKERSAIMRCLTEQDSRTSRLLQIFYFEPLGAHLNTVVQDFSDLEALLGSPVLNKNNYTGKVVQYYANSPKDLEPLLTTSYELASFLYYAGDFLPADNQTALIERHFNITKDSFLLEYLCSSPSINIFKEQSDTAEKMLSLEQYSNYAQILLSSKEIDILQKLAHIYLEKSDQIIKSVLHVPEMINLLNNVFVNETQSNTMVEKLLQHPQGLSHQISSLFDLQLIRRFNSLTPSDKDTILKNASFTEHPLTQFISLFQGGNTAYLAETALFGEIDSFYDMLLSDEYAFSFILQHADSIEKLGQLINNPHFSEEIRYNLCNQCLKMDADMWKHLVKTSYDLVNVPFVLGFDEKQSFTLGRIFSQGQATLLRGLHMSVGDLEPLADVLLFSREQRDSLPILYYEILLSRGVPFVDNFAAFDEELAFFAIHGSRTLSQKIQKFYWDAPIKRMLPLFRDIAEIQFLHHLFVGTDFELKCNEFIENQFIKKPIKNLLPLMVSTWDVVSFVDDYIPKVDQEVVGQKAYQARCIERHVFFNALLSPIHNPPLRGLIATMSDLLFFVEKSNLHHNHRNILWKSLKNNYYFWAHQLIKKPEDLFNLIHNIAPDRAAIEELSEFYATAPRHMGLRSLAKLAQSLPQSIRLGQALNFDMNNRALLNYLCLKEHVSFMNNWAPTLDEFLWHFPKLSPAHQYHVGSMIASHGGNYLHKIALTEQDKQAVLALPWHQEHQRIIGKLLSRPEKFDVPRPALLLSIAQNRLKKRRAQEKNRDRDPQPQSAGPRNNTPSAIKSSQESSVRESCPIDILAQKALIFLKEHCPLNKASKSHGWGKKIKS